jgi:hypothetical protein
LYQHKLPKLSQVFEITKRGKETINHGLCNRLDFCAAQAAYIFNKPSARLYEISFWDFGNAAVLNNESQRLEMAFINKSPCQRAAAVG